MNEVMYFTTLYEDLVNRAFEENPDKEISYDPINDFLLRIRKENF